MSLYGILNGQSSFYNNGGADVTHLSIYIDLIVDISIRKRTSTTYGITVRKGVGTFW